MKTKDKIVLAAIELIQIRSDLGWSYGDIAEAVEIRKASIHYHFPKKEDLIVEATRVYIQLAMEKIHENLSQATSLKEKVESIAECYRGVFCQKDRLCLCITLSQNFATKNPVLFKVIQKFYSDLRQLFIVLIEECKKTGEVREGLDSESMSTTFVALLQGLIILGEHGWSKEEFDKSLNQLIYLL